MADIDIYAWMFTAALIAGTFLPFLPASSELVLGGFLAAGQGTPGLLLAAATTGNVLGAVINYIAARYISNLTDRRWFPITEQQMQRASVWFNRYGFWSLFLSWLPFIGDVLTVIAGLMRTRFPIFFVLVSVGKFFRYFLIVAGTDWLIRWIG